MSTSIRRNRRGIYAALAALGIFAIMGFAALALDISMMRLAARQAQDAADAGAHAALQVLRNTGSTTDATAAAVALVGHNLVLSSPNPDTTVTFGQWDPTSQVFTAAAQPFNSARVEVVQDNLPFYFGQVLGHTVYDTSGVSVAAAQTLQVILVTDITASWDKDDFAMAREASLDFLEFLEGSMGPNDSIGHVVFLQRYGWEWTPMTALGDRAVSDQWANLDIGNLAGEVQLGWASVGQRHLGCKVYGTQHSYSGAGSWSIDQGFHNPSCSSNGQGNPFGDSCNSGVNCFSPSLRDEWADTNALASTGCHPAMPRYYSDEGGTDQSRGLAAAREMLEELDDPSHPLWDPMAYRAVIVLTDGQPVAYNALGGARRLTDESEGYVSPFRQWKITGSRSVGQIQTETLAEAQTLYDDYDANVWFVSFVEDQPWFGGVAKGDGWYENADSADELLTIYATIAQSLPQAIVQ